MDMHQDMMPMGAPAAHEPANFDRASFTGRASEYFGIWIVNILLSILTLGIYAAWAKVRRNRYFYGNTELLGSRFEYHATGKQIFLGRVIVFIVFSMINAIASVDPRFAFIGPILIILCLPWLIVKSLRFNARVTTYRNVQFDFVGKPWGAFVNVVVFSIISFVSLGLLAPFATRRFNQYVFNNFRYGDRPFFANPALKSLYKAWVLPACLVVLGAAIVALMGVFVYNPFRILDNYDLNAEEGRFALIGILYTILLILFVIFGLAGFLYKVSVRNIVWSSMVIDQKHQLKSDLNRWRFLWIVLSNLVVTILTCGLMRPWAAIRHARYTTEHTAISIQGEIGEVFSADRFSGNAISSEYFNTEGLDFGF